MRSDLQTLSAGCWSWSWCWCWQEPHWPLRGSHSPVWAAIPTSLPLQVSPQLHKICVYLCHSIFIQCGWKRLQYMQVTITGLTGCTVYLLHIHQNQFIHWYQCLGCLFQSQIKRQSSMSPEATNFSHHHPSSIIILQALELPLSPDTGRLQLPGSIHLASHRRGWYDTATKSAKTSYYPSVGRSLAFKHP